MCVYLCASMINNNFFIIPGRADDYRKIFTLLLRRRATTRRDSDVRLIMWCHKPRSRLKLIWLYCVSIDTHTHTHCLFWWCVSACGVPTEDWSHVCLIMNSSSQKPASSYHHLNLRVFISLGFVISNPLISFLYQFMLSSGGAFLAIHIFCHTEKAIHYAILKSINCACVLTGLGRSFENVGCGCRLCSGRKWIVIEAFPDNTHTHTTEKLHKNIYVPGLPGH